MSVAELLQAHRSCRSFDPDRPLSDEEITRLVSLGQCAATDATGQLYSFVAVRDVDLRDQVARLCGDQDQVRDAGCFLVTCVDVRRLRRLLEHRGATYGMGPNVALLFGITDAALAAQNIAVVAESEGLGICYIGALQNNVSEIIDLLGLPEGVLPLWGLCIGHPPTDWEQAVKPRVPTEAVLHWDRYADAEVGLMEACYDVMAKATRSGHWLHALNKYFGDDGHMAAREATFSACLRRQGFR